MEIFPCSQEHTERESRLGFNFPYIHAPFGKDREFLPHMAFTFETVYKFWIGFVIFPGLWAVIGIMLTVRALRTISKHVEISEQHYKHGKYYRSIDPRDSAAAEENVRKSNNSKKKTATTRKKFFSGWKRGRI